MSAALKFTDDFIQNYDAPLESGIQSLAPRAEDFGLSPQMLRLQDQFIENWGRMASAFAMDRTMGRVHALVYVSPRALDAQTIALRLASTEEMIEMHLEHLVS